MKKSDAKAAAVANDNPTGEGQISAEQHQEISRLAYFHWQARGCPIGSPEEDWYRAEFELRQQAKLQAVGSAA
jgi:Protein of unknown function (DUF2934)